MYSNQNNPFANNNNNSNNLFNNSNNNNNSNNLFANNNNNNNNNNNYIGNTLLRNSNEGPHQQHVLHVLNFIEDLQKNQEINEAKFILQNEYQSTLQDLQKCVSPEFPEGDQLFYKEVMERCLKIQRDNQIILSELLNFKEKLSKISHSNLEKDMTKEHEYSKVHEKIRKVKMSILNKMQRIRELQKYNKSERRMMGGPQGQIGVHKIVLDDLGNSVNVVARELIKQREEIKWIIKELYDEDV